MRIEQEYKKEKDIVEKGYKKKKRYVRASIYKGEG